MFIETVNSLKGTLGDIKEGIKLTFQSAGWMSS